VNALEQVAVAGEALARTIRLVRHPATWGWWLVPMLAGLATIAMFVGFAFPLWSRVTVVVLHRLGGERILHYPEALLALPVWMPRLTNLVSIAFGTLAAAATAAACGRLLTGHEATVRGVAWAALRRAPWLWIATLPAFAVGSLAATGVRSGFALLGTSHIKGVIMIGGAWGVQVLVAAAFLLVVPLVVMGPATPWRAWSRLPECWKHAGVASLVVAGVLGVVELAAAAGAHHAVRVASHVAPDRMPIIFAATLGIDLVAAWLAAGSAAILFGALVEDREE
jgi:hypothetical protein